MKEIISEIVAFVREWYIVPLILAYIGVFLTILLENRNPSKAIAYILILIFAPLLGLIVFFFFGRNFRKKIKFNLKEFAESERTREFVELLDKEHHQNVDQLKKTYGGLAESAVMLHFQRNSLTLGHNFARILTNGEEKFPVVFDALRRARHHIHIEYYILAFDAIGRELLEILEERARAGVEVRVLTDGAGSGQLRTFRKRCQQAGIHFKRFMPVRFSNLAASNYRNHRKIVVIDGKIGFIGGINMDERYMNNGKHSLYWRDTHLQLEGPSVDLLQFHFLNDWKFVSGESLPFDMPYFGVANRREGDTTYVAVAASGPTSARPHGMDTMVSLIYEAREQVCLTNPYYIPSDELQSALIQTAASGVQVRLIIPSISDSFIVGRAMWSYLQELLENGVKVFLYERGFIHAKTMVVDGSVSLIGSLNADIRSFYINFEASALIYDSAIGREMVRIFEEDLVQCSELLLEELQERSFGNRFLDSACRLLTPLL